MFSKPVFFFVLLFFFFKADVFSPASHSRKLSYELRKHTANHHRRKCCVGSLPDTPGNETEAAAVGGGDKADGELLGKVVRGGAAGERGEAKVGPAAVVPPRQGQPEQRPSGVVPRHLLPRGLPSERSVAPLMGRGYHARFVAGVGADAAAAAVDARPLVSLRDSVLSRRALVAFLRDQSLIDAWLWRGWGEGVLLDNNCTTSVVLTSMHPVVVGVALV